MNVRRFLMLCVSFVLCANYINAQSYSDYPYPGYYAVFDCWGKCLPCQVYDTPLNEVPVVIYIADDDEVIDTEAYKDTEFFSIHAKSGVILERSGGCLVLSEDTPLYMNGFSVGGGVGSISGAYLGLYTYYRGFIAWQETETHGPGRHYMVVKCVMHMEGPHLILKLE